MLEPVKLGRSGLEATAMGLGLAALGRPGYINLGHALDFDDRSVEAMQAQAWRVLDVAWDSGVRYFDAARSYGRAEGFLGSWLRYREIDPGAVRVASKWGYTYTAAWRVNATQHEVKAHSVDVLKRQWNESQALLGDYLDLYQIHSATLDSGVLENPQVLAQLAEYKAAGVAVGLSLSGPGQGETLTQAMACRVDGAPLFDTVQATWNLLEPSAGEALRDAHDAGMGVVIKEALANGRLTDRNTEPAFFDQKQRLVSVATANEVGIDAVALAMAIRQPWVDVVLSGAATERQLLDNLRATDIDVDLDSHGFAEQPERDWSTRSGLVWN